MARRIDSLKAGDKVVLEFTGSMGNEGHVETMIFKGITGEGTQRRATFADVYDSTSDWEAYRYNGYWAYGTSADRLRLLEVVAD